MDTNWSNPVGANAWLHDGVIAPAGQYPGMPLSTDDVVYFNSKATGGADLDTPLANSLNSLLITNWQNTLTLLAPLTISGSTGAFQLLDNSTIDLRTNPLTLQNLGYAGANLWGGGGTIDGGVGSSFDIFGTALLVKGSVGGLEPQMNIGMLGSNPGSVTLSNMTGNLGLYGQSNYIDVQSGGSLNLYQAVAAGRANRDGGIVIAGSNPGTLAVQVESGGTLERRGLGGTAPNSVRIGGAVYNKGGLVEVDGGSILSITGTDPNGQSYWQTDNSNAQLTVDSASNINASGTFQINAGTVTLMAANGGNTPDELDGKGLFFGSGATRLTIVDAAPGTPGTVTVNGPVTLGAQTLTTMNFNGTANTADLLDVQNGVLTLAGGLSLVASDGKKPTAALNFFDDIGAAGAINGSFMGIMDNVGGTDTGAVVGAPPTLDYQVTIK